ncbi:hypothetical protein WIS52_08895 [Pseudonocardia nematodicida]|uniref:Uncharacterized protein n=1 Tax=Pseudonocardia nematodicida TaxID=1206997 RepID=A0ABV1K7W2_9PSEU
MRTGWNVLLQIGALVAFLGLRVLAPGWFLVIVVITIVPAVLLLVPTVLSLVVIRRRVLTRAVSAPFVACAATLVLTGLVMPDFGDTADSVRAPVQVLLGISAPDVATLLQVPGMLFVLGWIASLLWLCVALIATSRMARRRRAPAPPHPTWQQPTG